MLACASPPSGLSARQMAYASTAVSGGQGSPAVAARAAATRTPKAAVAAAKAAVAAATAPLLPPLPPATRQSATTLRVPEKMIEETPSMQGVPLPAMPPGMRTHHQHHPPIQSTHPSHKGPLP